jgi:hypothetical protein
MENHTSDSTKQQQQHSKKVSVQIEGTDTTKNNPTTFNYRHWYY